jgi:hypothetical protein
MPCDRGHAERCPVPFWETSLGGVLPREVRAFIFAAMNCNRLAEEFKRLPKSPAK